MSANKKIGFKKYNGVRYAYSKRSTRSHNMRFLTSKELAAWFTAVEQACKKLK